MNVLSGVLPGLRDIRTPLTVGTLWSLVIGLLAAGRWEELASRPRLSALTDVLSGLPDTYTLGAVAVAVYLVGAIVTPLQNYCLSRALQWARTRGRPIAIKWESARRIVQRTAGRVTRRLRQTFSEESGASPSIVGDAVASKLTRVGVPMDLVYLFPSHNLVYRLNALAPQLQVNAPTQAQEFDRFRAEAEFRRGVSVPLSLFFALVAWEVSPLLLPVAGFVFVVLLGQSFRRERAAAEVLANALYLGSMKMPALERCVESLQENPPPKGSSVGVWAAATAVALKGTEEAWLGRTFAEGFYRQYSGTQENEVQRFRDYVQATGPENADLLGFYGH